MFASIVHGSAAGKVQTVACGDALSVDEALASLELAGGAALRHVARTWHDLPDLDTLLDDLIGAMADAALALWPDWYPQRGPGVPSDVESIASTVPRVSGPWLEAAARRCADHRQPRGESFPRATMALQLSLALGDQRYAMILATEDVRAPRHRVLALAKAAEWLATNTGARVVVLVPESLARDPALESVAYRAIRLPATSARPAGASDGELRKRSVWPILGRPHPFSPGEQLLALRLANDEELAPLFAFNQSVITRAGSRYLVDLLWNPGRVVVEIDGFHTHSGRVAFNSDRHRDFELVTSGYLVLRLPHDEVEDDPAMAIEKIRDVVRFRLGATTQ